MINRSCGYIDISGTTPTKIMLLESLMKINVYHIVLFFATGQCFAYEMKIRKISLFLKPVKPNDIRNLINVSLFFYKEPQ